MTEQNDFPYEIVKKKEIVASDYTIFKPGESWIVSIYTICDGGKLGVTYNRKEKYEILLDCKWDYIDYIDTEYGGYIVVYSKGKCCCYSLSGKCDYSDFSITIEIRQICDCIYNDIAYVGACKGVLLFYDKDNVRYYDIQKKFFSESFDWIRPIDCEFLECCTDENITRININNGILFPETPNENSVFYLCRYEEGRVYSVFTERGHIGDSWEGYLVFYSEKDRLFYKTETYGKINVLGMAKRGWCLYMTGFEAIKNGKNTIYKAKNGVWADDDMNMVPKIQSFR